MFYDSSQKGMEFFSFKDMNKIDQRHKNGYGFAVNPAEVIGEFPKLRFEESAYDVMDSVLAEGSCLVEGGVGTGKSHLVQDVDHLMRYTAPHVTTLNFSAHKNVGTKRGVKNALDVFDKFVNSVGDEGIIIIDNVDMYGYSGSSAKRQYSLAKRHTEVAAYLIDLLGYKDAPLIIGTSHDELWRSQHWKYQEKKKDKDEVTPIAEELLGSFATQYTFGGLLSEEVAFEILTREKELSPSQAKVITERLSSQNDLTHRLISKLDKEALLKYGLDAEIEKIQARAEVLTNGVSLSRQKLL